MEITKEILDWQEIEVGGVVTAPGNAAEYKTGDWRTNKPIWDRDKCIKCGVCYVFCPEPAINEVEGGWFEGDMYYCKGCGICARECITQSIKMVAEEE